MWSSGGVLSSVPCQILSEMGRKSVGKCQDRERWVCLTGGRHHCRAEWRPFWDRARTASRPGSNTHPPSPALRAEERLGFGQTLLGHYRGIPHTARGDNYGVGNTLPDTITLFRLPIENEAITLGGGEENLRKAIRETIWHEVAHHFGMDEHEVRAKEAKRQK